ncbi:unnamed protein product, partial [Nesidiocoris tenuis]
MHKGSIAHIANNLSGSDRPTLQDFKVKDVRNDRKINRDLEEHTGSDTQTQTEPQTQIETVFSLSLSS